MGYYNIYNFLAGSGISFANSMTTGNLGSGSWLYWDAYVDQGCFILES